MNFKGGIFNTPYKEWQSAFESAQQFEEIKKYCKTSLSSEALYKNEILNNTRLGGPQIEPKKSERKANTLKRWPPTGIKEFLRQHLELGFEEINEPIMYLLTRYCNTFENLQGMKKLVNYFDIGTNVEHETLFLHIFILVHRVCIRVMQKVTTSHIESLDKSELVGKKMAGIRGSKWTLIL